MPVPRLARQRSSDWPRTDEVPSRCTPLGHGAQALRASAVHVICTDRGLCVSYVPMWQPRIGSARCGRRYALCKQYRYDASDLYSVAYMEKNLWLPSKVCELRPLVSCCR